MRIAVASQNYRTVFDHAGKARRFLVYEVSNPCATPIETGRLDLAPEYAFHGFNDQRPHPLDGVDVLIVGGCGGGFPARLARRGIEVVATGEGDPLKAISAYFDGKLPPPRPHDDHDHDHDHGHDHAEDPAHQGGCGCGGGC
jgi:predicted Fe-Mo cluster-binding NifX family protein